MVFDLSQFQFDIKDEAYDILNDTIAIGNAEGIRDSVYQIVQHGHKKTGYSSSSPPGTSQSSGTGGKKFKITVEKLPDQALETNERPDNQKRSLANLNCGSGTGKYQTFSKKHLIYPESVPKTRWSGLSFLITLLNRIQDPFQIFSYFFYEEGRQEVEYSYDETKDLCQALDYLPTISCQRYQKSDHIHVCTDSGQCRPSYLKTSGHLYHLDCRRQPSESIPDFVVTRKLFGEVQKQFLQDFINEPPTELDWKLSRWRAQRLTAIRNNRPFDVPKPTGVLSRREQIYISYQNALKNKEIESIPEDVKKVFYTQPELYVTSIPDRERRGVLVIGSTWLTVNPDHVPLDLSSIPPPITNENFPVLPKPKSRPSGNERVPTEYQASSIPDEYDRTSRVGHEIITRNFPNQAEQQLPSDHALDSIYQA